MYVAEFALSLHLFHVIYQLRERGRERGGRERERNIAISGVHFVCLAPSSHRIEKEFCLVEPVRTLVPGHVHYQETDDHKMLPIPISHVGAEEHFRQLVRERECGHGSVKDGLFDKILLHDGCRYLTEPATLFSDMATCLAPGGIMLIVHRPAHLSTLPVFKDAQQRSVHTHTHTHTHTWSCTCLYVCQIVHSSSCRRYILPLFQTISAWEDKVFAS